MTADGCCSRRDRSCRFLSKLGCAYGAPLLVATSARTVRGALPAGLVCAALVFVLQLVVAWFVSHPIE